MEGTKPMPKDIEMFFVHAAHHFVKGNYWTTLDYLAKLELRTFKLAMAELRMKEDA